LVKKCLQRHGVSLYTIKKIKGKNKISKQTSPTHQVLKNHYINNAEMCTMKCDVRMKSLLKTIDSYKSIKSNTESVINDSLEPHLSTQVCTKKRVMMKNNLTKTYNISSEETTIVRHGAKRLKIISSTKIPKMSICDIGEPSYAIMEEIKVKTPSKIPRIRDKQNLREMRNIRKHDRLTEQIKLNKSKLKK